MARPAWVVITSMLMMTTGRALSAAAVIFGMMMFEGRGVNERPDETMDCLSPSTPAL